jgi:D-aminoacyl-tRNA deacylase
MRAVLQRVSSASVTVDGVITGSIGKGLLVLLGVASGDDESTSAEMVDKIVGLRIFNDDAGKMNLSLQDIDGEMLVVSQFTLYADTSRGRRPSFLSAADPSAARSLYEHFVSAARESVPTVETGVFGAMMQVELINDGPVTIILDSNDQI